VPGLAGIAGSILGDARGPNARTVADAKYNMVAIIQALASINWAKTGGYISCLGGANASDILISKDGAGLAASQDANDTPDMRFIAPQRRYYGHTNLKNNGGQEPLNPSQQSPVPGNVAGGTAQAASTFQCIANVYNTW
jgi:hypothetical protein